MPDMILDVDWVRVESLSGGQVRATIVGVDISDIYGELSSEQVDDLLEEIGREAAIDYWGIEEAE
jgi:hypothetical protein